MNKKFILMVILVISLFGFSMNVKANQIKEENDYTNILLVNSDDAFDGEPVATNFCTDVKSGVKILGYIILVIKVAVPLGVIIMGTFDIYKTVTTGNQDDLKKQLVLLGKRALAGLIIFFLPTILDVVINAVGDSNADYKTCTNCLFNPTNC